MDLRNFKDFLQIYNLMSENCFNRCVNTFQSRELAEDEVNCVNLCSDKHVRVNHKVMGVYMEVQPMIVQKRIEEMEKLNATVNSSVTPEATEATTVSPSTEPIISSPDNFENPVPSSSE